MLTINKGAIFEPMELVNLGFKQCTSVEKVQTFLERDDVTSVVLTDYNNRNHIFFLNQEDRHLSYFKPFEKELDGILFESTIN